MLGQQWSREASDVKARWKAVADDIKRKHSEMFPDYQYQPRKPSEKKRRMTRRKAAALAGLADSQGHALPAQSHDTTMAGGSGDQVVASASTSSSTDIETADSPALLNDIDDNVAADQPEPFEIEDIPEVLPVFETASNGNLSLDLDGSFSDEAFSAMLAEYNESVSAPAPQQAGLNLPNDYPVLSFNATEETTNDQSFFSSMCDWEDLGQEAEGYANNALPELEPEAQFDWEKNWSFLANAELERMPA